MRKDHVDFVIRQWAEVRPDLDVSPMAVIGRLVRARSIFSSQLQPVFTRYDLNSGEFDVLATLLRSNKPYTLPPNRLLQALMLSSGAMTNRIDKLESKQLVERKSDPSDRRGVLVSLTDKGYNLINEAVITHINNGRKLLQCLDPQEQEALAALLRKILLEYESANQSLD
ncbi:MAG: MarR family transcriptional regulator [Candidatus Sedimenticola sp. (ex Thyasira tokunagai)]